MRSPPQPSGANCGGQARPLGEFDPSRYFRTTERLTFLNVRTPVVRAAGRAVAREHLRDWSRDDAVAFAELLLREPALELKAAGLAALGVRRRELGPTHLAVFKRWLARNHAANWATTDTLCGTLISPLLFAHPALVPGIRSWAAHRNLWVRRAAAVSLVRHAARGQALDAVYDTATALLADPRDLIHKATGWLLREAGRTNPSRLAAYLLRHGSRVPRTTLRYAIERFPPADRARLLVETRAAPVRRTPRPSNRHIPKFFR